jgi:hypothetical protein
MVVGAGMSGCIWFGKLMAGGGGGQQHNTKTTFVQNPTARLTYFNLTGFKMLFGKWGNRA